jgi:hypothetical protein
MDMDEGLSRLGEREKSASGAAEPENRTHDAPSKIVFAEAWPAILGASSACLAADRCANTRR